MTTPKEPDRWKPVQWLRELTDTVLVGLSGGKDSVAALDVCHRHGIKCVAYFMYQVKGLRYQHEYLDELTRRYNLTIYEYPHPDRVQFLRDGYYCIRQEQLPPISFREVWEAARVDSGVEWIVTGEKKVDSLERRAQMSAWGAVQPARRRAFPLAEWRHSEVYDYLQHHRIPLAPEYEALGESVNFLLKGRNLAWLAERYPDDYEKVLKDFPMAEASRMRFILNGDDD